MIDPWSLFLYVMKAPMTREKYRGRLARLFDFIGLTEGTMEVARQDLHGKGKETTRLGISKRSALYGGSERKGRKWRDKPYDS